MLCNIYYGADIYSTAALILFIICQEQLPFAVVGSDRNIPVSGKAMLGRKTRWGIIEGKFSYIQGLPFRQWANPCTSEVDGSFEKFNLQNNFASYVLESINLKY